MRNRRWLRLASLVLATGTLLIASPVLPQDDGEAMEADLAAMLDAGPAGEPARSDSTRVNVGALKSKHTNAVVRVEFTMISNLNTVKLNPTKSESYYSGNEPPHGSGFFINGTDILTNSHVVEDSRQSSIRIKSPATGNVEFRVEIVGLSNSEDLDLAVLRLPPDEVERFKKRSGLSVIPHVELGDSDTLGQADTIAIFGYPEDSDELKVIEASVTGRQYLKSYGGDWFVGGFKFIEVGPAAVIQPGNSGGPALDADGKVVGIPARGSGWASEQGWLIPSNIAKHYLDQIYASKAGDVALALPDLGVYLAENFEGTSVLAGASEELVVFQAGIVIREVLKGSLAEKWGLQSGDILVGFRNEEKRLGAALDFEGNTITTGRYSQWPQDGSGPLGGYLPNNEKRHIRELFLISSPGDTITLSYIRPGDPALKEITNRLEDIKLTNMPHLGVFQRPDFELWGEFVAQDFNTHNIDHFDVPRGELAEGGALVTYVEPNGLASRRGMKIGAEREWFMFSSAAAVPLQGPRYRDVSVPWVIIEAVNGVAVKNLADFRREIRKAESEWEAITTAPGYDPAGKLMLAKRYATIGYRTKGADGETIHLKPAFPIDEAMETSRELLRNFKEQQSK